MGELRPTTRRLRSANGSQIDIRGCSFCVVSFLGLRTEFSILACDLSTDAIIGTNILGSILPHTLDIKHGLLFTEGGVSLQLHRRCVHRGTLLDSTIFGGSSSLYHSYCGWPVDATQRTARGLDHFIREHQPGSGPDTGKPIKMKDTNIGIKLWTGDRNGGAIF